MLTPHPSPLSCLVHFHKKGRRGRVHHTIKRTRLGCVGLCNIGFRTSMQYNSRCIRVCIQYTAVKIRARLIFNHDLIVFLRKYNDGSATIPGPRLQNSLKLTRYDTTPLKNTIRTYSSHSLVFTFEGHDIQQCGWGWVEKNTR